MMKRTLSLLLMISILTLLAGCGGQVDIPVSSEPSLTLESPSVTPITTPTTTPTTTPSQSESPTPSASPTPEPTPAPTPTATPSPISGEPLKVHFIDVGQADSILVQQGESAMLIDAGNNGDSDLVLQYIKDQNIKNFDYVIGTHPHEDHIGGLDKVIDTFSISTLIMPKVSNTTKTFEDVLDSIEKKSLKVTTPIPGTEYQFADSKFTILAPNSSKYDELNDYSVVIKLVFGDTSFLLTGDAEAISEKEMLEKNYDLKADVLKVGHHGSTSSTTDNFLKAVAPKYAVISVGADNDYGHPAPSTVQRLNSAGVEIYQTQEVGTIIVTSDGKAITIDKKASPKKEQAPPVASIKPTPNPTPTPKAEVIVYITKTGEKYHMDGCRSLSKSKIPIMLSEAKSKGFGACSICKPPK